MLSIAGSIFNALYLLVLVVLTVYGLHRYWEVILYYWTGRKEHLAPPAPREFPDLPPVTIQLPMFNERYVATRVIEAAARMDYPRHLLQIQVLDDSTDDSAEIARSTCQRLRETGQDIQYIHRNNRFGYKAGALENGLATAKGEFIAIFDADFIPPSDMLRGVIHHFTDPAIGCVQTRWEHINRRHSLLTCCQAIFLDGHFVIEHAARNRSGRFINFNGTGGVWRKSAIVSSGGWQHDTLTEDLDLSYRAQLCGWHLVFLPKMICPAELPPEIVAFKRQQHRWTKGSVQTAVKLLPSLLKKPLPLRVKVEAFLHLCSGVVYPMAVLLSLLLFPTFFLGGPGILFPASPVLRGTLLTMFIILTFSAGTFYMVAQRELGESWIRAIVRMPMLMAVAMGISLTNSLAVLEALFRHESEFTRTPKYGIQCDTPSNAWKSRAAGFRQKINWLPFAEIGLGLYLLLCAIAAVVLQRAEMCVPFLLIFMCGYLYVGILSLYAQCAPRRGKVSDSAFAPAMAG